METYTYEDIGEVSAVKNSGLQLAMHTGGRVVVTTNKAGKSWSLEGVEITSYLNTSSFPTRKAKAASNAF